MRAHGALQLLIAVMLAGAASPAAGSPWVSLDPGSLAGMNTTVTLGGGLAIDEVAALEASGTWYRYPWGFAVWDIQLAKSSPTTGWIGTEPCLRVVDNAWASEPLHAFNGRLMRVGPCTAGTCVATLASGTVLAVPGFATRPVSLRFLTFGSHGGASAYTVTLNYTSGGPAVVVVPIASASVYPRDASGSGWSTQEVAEFVSLCTGQYGDMVVIANPRPTSDLSSVVITFDGVSLTGPIAVSLSLQESDYLAGYQFMGSAWSGNDQATAMRAPEGTVPWEGVDWSATIPDAGSEILVRVYCGEAAEGGSVLWQHAGDFDLTAGAGSALLNPPCTGEFVMCEIDMVAELAVSPVLDSLRFRYAGPAGVGDEGRQPHVLLAPGVPNPFRSTTSLRFELLTAARARLAVYDISGRLIRRLLDADLPAGVHRAAWDGRDATGRPLASGSYVLRLEAGEGTATARVKLVR